MEPQLPREKEDWMNLQKAYELRLAEQTVGKEIEKTVKPRAA